MFGVGRKMGCVQYQCNELRRGIVENVALMNVSLELHKSPKLVGRPRLKICRSSVAGIR